MSGAPRIVGVIGDPIAHSLSPSIHELWIARHGLEARYVPLRMTAEAAPAWVRGFAGFGFTGFNVTTPHKEAAFAAVDAHTPQAAAAGSVNLVSLDGEGRVLGDSTDGWGFLESLRESAGWRAEGARVAMIGAGGAARAVAAALCAAGAREIRICNRTSERAKALARGLKTLGAQGVEVWPWPAPEPFFHGVDLIVNGSKLGMAGDREADGPLWALPALDATVVATDFVYAPLETPFLAAAKAAGARTVDGLGMLLHQARPSFEAWFGVRPDADAETRDAALAALARRAG